MRRRTVIATVTSALLAGCGNFQEATTSAAEAVEEKQRIPAGVEPVSDIGIEGDLSVESGADVQPVDDIGIDQDIEIAEDIGVQGDLNYNSAQQLEGQGLDENGDPIEEDERAAEFIDRARSHLETAISTYTSYAGRDAELTDVNATMTDFDAIAVTREIRPARRDLERASSSATMGQQTIIMALGQCASFLENAAMVDEALTEAYEQFQFTKNRILNEQGAQAKMARQRFQSRLDDAESAKNALERLTRMQMMAAFDQISAETYRQKIRQLNLAIFTLDQFQTGLQQLQSSIQKTTTAATKYNNEAYQTAANRLLTATTNAGMATHQFGSVKSLTGLREPALDTSLVTRTLEQTLHDLERHVRATYNENRILANEALEAAEQHYDSNETVSSLDAWNGFPF